MAMGAGILLAAKFYLIGAEDLLGIPVWILWLGEFLAYLAAILIWAPGISAGHLILGIAAIFLMRTMISGGAASVGQSLQAEGELAAAFAKCFTEPLPRACSVIFALMAAYPLRALLPRRGPAVMQKGRISKQAPAAEAPPTSKGATFLFGAPAGQNIDRSARAASYASRTAAEASPPLPGHLMGMKMKVPLRVIFPQLPAGVIKPEIADKVFQESDEMSIEIPLTLIAPQLKEALIQISVAALLTFLPKAWADTPAEGGEDMVDLPLEVIVPQLPDEVVQLPPPSPPAWAAAANQQAEEVLFARV